eukprot:13716690-Alexandrium_andersonii.AAC.1
MPVLVPVHIRASVCVCAVVVDPRPLFSNAFRPLMVPKGSFDFWIRSCFRRSFSCRFRSASSAFSLLSRSASDSCAPVFPSPSSSADPAGFAPGVPVALSSPTIPGNKTAAALLSSSAPHFQPCSITFASSFRFSLEMSTLNCTASTHSGTSRAAVRRI